LKGFAREIFEETKNPLLFFRDFTDGNGYVAEEFLQQLSRMTYDATHDARQLSFRACFRLLYSQFPRW
jgi:hypothetical protein